MKARRRRLKRNRLAKKPPPPICQLVLVGHDEVDEFWILAEDFIRTAERYGEYSADELKEWTLGGYAQLWLAWSDHCEAAMITRIIDTPMGSVCLIAALGGEAMSRWIGLLANIEGWAKAQGCFAIRLYGRLGWMRKLPDYDLTRVILDKRLI